MKTLYSLEWRVIQTKMFTYTITTDSSRKIFSSHPITTMPFIWGKEVREGEKIYIFTCNKTIYRLWILNDSFAVIFALHAFLPPRWAFFYRHFIWSNVKQIRFYSHFPHDLSNVRFLPPNTQGFEF